MLINAFATFVFMNKCVIILSPEERRRNELTEIIKYYLIDNFKKASIPDNHPNDIRIPIGEKFFTVELFSYPDFSNLGANMGDNGEILVVIDGTLVPTDPKTLPRLNDSFARTKADVMYASYTMSIQAYQKKEIPCLLEDFNANYGNWNPKKLIEGINLVKDKIKKRLEDSV